MKLNVLIAAHNEAANIGWTLEHLDAATVEPTVIVNGSSDDTAVIARRYTDRIIVRDEPGKLPALQAGMETIDLAEPFVTMDGDTRPLMPKRYAAGMLAARAACDPERPAVIVGGSIYSRDCDPFVLVKRSVTVLAQQHRDRYADDSSGFYGRNMLFDTQGDQGAIDTLMALPHYWPREDIAMKDVLTHGFDGSTFKSSDPRAMVLTSGERFSSLHDRLTLGADACYEKRQGSYASDTAPGAVPYNGFEESLVPVMQNLGLEPTGVTG